MKRKLLIGLVVFLIVINLSFFAVGYYSYLYPSLGDFTIETVVETDKFLALNVTPSSNATKYEVEVVKDEEIIYQKAEETNQISLENLEANYNDQLKIKVKAYNKNNEEKESSNTYNYVYKDASFNKEQDHLLSKTTDLFLNIDGYNANEEYIVRVYYGKKMLYSTEEVSEKTKIPYEALQDYSGRLTAVLYTKNERKLSTFTFYLNTPIVGKLELLSPSTEFSTRWNDIKIIYNGGENANHFYVYLYSDGNLINQMEVVPENNEVIIPASMLSQNTTYTVVFEAVYEDYFEISEKLSFTLNISKIETTNPVYVSHNPSFIKAGTQIELKSRTSDTTIYYTTDGSDPSTSSMVYDSPITINENMTLKTYAASSNRYDSAMNTYEFQIRDKTPVIYLSPSNQYDNYGVSEAGYTTEKEMMNKLADVIGRELENAGFIVYRNNPYGDINAWNSFSNAVGADFHFAIHSNGSTNHTARGVEIHVDDETSPALSIAANIYDNLYKIYPGNTNPLYNRGIKYARGSLGEVNNNYVNNGALIEVAFHDNYDDALWIAQNLEQIGQNIASSIISYYN